MNAADRERLRAVIKQAFADPYPPDLAPPATGRISWREQHVLKRIDEEFQEPKAA